MIFKAGDVVIIKPYAALGLVIRKERGRPFPYRVRVPDDRALGDRVPDLLITPVDRLFMFAAHELEHCHDVRRAAVFLAKLALEIG